MEFGLRKFMTFNPGGKNQGKLFVMDNEGEWRSYEELPFKVPDWKFEGLEFGKPSKGYATMQALLKNGWQMVNGRDY